MGVPDHKVTLYSFSSFEKCVASGKRSLNEKVRREPPMWKTAKMGYGPFFEFQCIYRSCQEIQTAIENNKKVYLSLPGEQVNLCLSVNLLCVIPLGRRLSVLCSRYVSLTSSWLGISWVGFPRMELLGLILPHSEAIGSRAWLGRVMTIFLRGGGSGEIL